MKENLQKLYVQIIFWKSHNIIALCWAFYWVNDNKDVDVKSLQIMCLYFLLQQFSCNFKPKNLSKKND